MNSKDLLAKLLATEDIDIIYKKVSTAAFDLGKRQLILPMWKDELSDDVTDLLIGHEVGHALFTPVEQFRKLMKKKNRAPHTYYNVVEDARIEKMIKAKFPGLAGNFYRGYKELKESEHFGKGVEKKVDSMNLIDRINTYYKMGYLVNVPFAEEEKKFLTRIDDARTFKQVRKIAEDVFAYSKEQQEKQKEEEGEQEGDTNGQGKQSGQATGDMQAEDDFDDSSEGDGSETLDWGDDEKESKSSDTDDDGEDEGDSQGQDGEDENDGDKDGEGMSPETTEADGGSEHHPGNFSDLDSQTEKEWNRSYSDLLDDDSVERKYINYGDYDYKPFVEDYKVVYDGVKADSQRKIDESFNSRQRDMSDQHERFLAEGRKSYKEFKDSTKKAVAYLAREFEMKKSADEYKKINISKTGVLNPIKLHAYKYDDHIFKTSTTTPDGKNHGLVFFIDWSSSMHGVIRNTLRQLFSLTMFCKRVNIPFEVYAFTNASTFEKHIEYRANRNNRYIDDTVMYPLPENVCKTWKEGYASFDPGFKLMNIISSRMKAQEYTYAMEFLFAFSENRGSHFIPYVFALSGTPLQAAIMVSENLIKDFQRKNRLQVVNAIYLSDGDSNMDLGEIVPERIGSTTLQHSYGVGRFVTIKDQKSKKDYKVDNGDTHEYTSVLLKILSDRTGCNIIGFNILGGSVPRWIERATEKSQTEILSAIRKEKFFGTKLYGYDDYYLLNNSNMDVNIRELEVDSSMTKKKMKTAFLKHQKSKLTERVLLGRFVEQII